MDKRQIVRKIGDGAEHVELQDLQVGDEFIPDGGPDDPWEHGQNTYRCDSQPVVDEKGVWGCQVTLMHTEEIK